MKKSVLITGISRGIGKALAQKFLSEGYFVIGTSTKGTSDISNDNLITLQLDLANPKSIKSCAEKISELKKPIDILINNAAVILLEKDNDRNEINTDTLRKVLEIDLLGTIDFTMQIIPIINKGGHIVNISSRQGSFDYVFEIKNPSYQISKAGLNMFTRVLSFQLKDKITVSSVHPGAVLSGLAARDANMLPEEAAEYIYKTAISNPKTGQFWFKGELFPW
jgi:NAD(P)-dependent dehydrogenase (short-subunit alcohol dehydrogenase family)